MTKLILTILALTLIVTLSSGCGSKEQTQAADGTKSAESKPVLSETGDSASGLTRKVLPREPKNYDRDGLTAPLRDKDLKRIVSAIGDPKDGRKKVEVWYPDGQKKIEGQLLNGKKDGPYTSWFPNGNLERKLSFKDDKPDDTSLIYWESGNPKQLTVHVNGLRDGLFEEYREDGTILKRGNNVAGKVEGLYTAYHPNGAVEFKGQYKQGKMVGLWEKFHPDGQLKARVEYVDDKRHGKYETWDLRGIPGPIEIFEHGVRVGQEYPKGDTRLNQ